MADAKDIIGMYKDLLSIKKGNKGTTLPVKAVEDMTNEQTLLKGLKDMADLKMKGFGGQGISTGPVVGRIPNYLSSLWNQYGEGLSATDAADRAKLDAAKLWVANPIRHATTGAQASYQELKNQIYPLIPDQTDEDAIWKTKLMEAAQRTLGNYQQEQQNYKNSGYDANFNDLSPLLDQLKGVLYPAQQGK